MCNCRPSPAPALLLRGGSRFRHRSVDAVYGRRWQASRVPHGATAAPAPRLGSLGSPCTCTVVHLGSSAPNCTVHLGASELMRTRIKVLIRPLAPNRTVHLGASERLTVCVAQPGNGNTSTHRSQNLPSATVIHENQVRLSSGSEILFDDL